MVAKVSRAEAANYLMEHIDAHTFSPKTGESDINFSYNVLRWIIGNFVVYERYQRITSEYYDGYSSSRAPESVKPLFLTPPIQDMKYSINITSAVEFCAETEIVPAKIPALQTLRDSGLNYPQIIDGIIEDTALLEGSSMARMYLLPKYSLDFQCAPSHSPGPGLRIVVSRHSASVTPYGRKGETDSVTAWMMTYHDKLHILSKVVAVLGALTLENSNNAIDQVDQSDLDALGVYLAYTEPEDLSPEYLYGETLEGVILRQLVERGLISIDELRN